MPKKEVFLSNEAIEHIRINNNGKYSEYIREAVESRIQKEKDDANDSDETHRNKIAP